MPRQLPCLQIPIIVMALCWATLEPRALLAQEPGMKCPGGPQASRGEQRAVPEELWRQNLAGSIEGVLGPGLVKALQDAVQGFMEHVPAASVAVAVPGQGLWQDQRGVVRRKSRRSAKGKALPERSLFQVASISKTFTAVLALQMVEEGKLSLEMPVQRWFPDLPHAERITVRHLLEHTSGLHSFNALPGGRDLGSGYRAPAELVEVATEYPLQFCPGEGWAYTNTGYVLLGQLVEQVSGLALHELLQQRILGPLGLLDTVMRRPGVAESKVVSGHSRGAPVPKSVDYATPYAAGGLASTAADLVRFWRALLAGELLRPATVQTMFAAMYPMQPMFPAPPQTTMYYGRGVQMTVNPGGEVGPGLMLNHGGGIVGFNAVVAYLAEDEIYVAVAFSDKEVPADAGLWALVKAVRGYRAAQGLSAAGQPSDAAASDFG